MTRLNTTIHKIMISVTLFITIFLCIQPARAQEEPPKAKKTECTSPLSCLQQLLFYEQDILERVNTAVLAWTSRDESKSTDSLRETFGKLYNLSVTTPEKQLAMQRRLMNDFFKNSGGEPVTQKSQLPYANDLSYTTLLNEPFFKDNKKKNDPEEQKAIQEAAYNYVVNASGMKIQNPNPTPNNNWGGGSENIKTYEAIYSTISAVQTFNFYALSQLLINKNELTQTQRSLEKTASNSDWFAEIAGEKQVGNLLRKILMFVSQSYVLSTRSLELQQQMVTAQSMTNTLLILLNEATAKIAYSNARQSQTQGQPK